MLKPATVRRQAPPTVSCASRRQTQHAKKTQPLPQEEKNYYQELYHLETQQNSSITPRPCLLQIFWGAPKTLHAAPAPETQHTQRHNRDTQLQQLSVLSTMFGHILMTSSQGAPAFIWRSTGLGLFVFLFLRKEKELFPHP